MTPLAAYLAKQIISRPKHREHIWVEPKNIELLRDALGDIHCFEVTACFPLLAELAERLGGEQNQDAEKRGELFSKYAFLPAPKTWIEWKHSSGNRVAILLEQTFDNRAVATLYCATMAENLGWISTNSDDHFTWGGKQYVPDFLELDGFGVQVFTVMIGTGHSMLPIINSPKIIGQRRHTPNAGLARSMNRAGILTPHPWTEIKLQVSKPPEIDDGEPHEAYLTGRRALHFCRKHIRIKNGRLEYVSAHWRGDPAIGIKQSRYVVAP